MISIKLVGPLLLCVVGAPMVAQTPVLRTYDVRLLLTPEHAWQTGDLVTPTPEAVGIVRTGFRPAAPLAALTEDELLAIVSGAFSTAANGGTAPLLHLVGNILFATADEEAQRRLATWIEVCQQVFLEQVTLEVHLLPPAKLAGTTGRLHQDEVDSLLRTAGPHPTFTCSGRVGSTLMLRSDRGATYVQDVNVEVAQKSSIFDPILDAMITGEAWEITTARCADGRLLVDVRGQGSGESSPPPTLEIPHRDQRGQQQKTSIQLTDLRYRAGTAAARLEDGEALLFGGEGDQGVACCVRLRRAHALPLPSGADWSWLATADLTRARPAARSAHLRLVTNGDDAPRRSTADEPPPVLTPEQLAAQLLTVPGFDDSEQVRILPAGLLCTRGEAPLRKAAADLLRGLAGDLARDLTVEVRCSRLTTAEASLVAEARLDAAEVAGRAPATLLAPVLLDWPFHHQNLRQHAHVTDYVVEIAQEAAVPNPVVDTVDEGLAITGRVTAAGRDRFRLALDVSFAELSAPIQRFDLEDEDLGPVELAQLRTVTFSVSPIVDAGRWTLMYVAPLTGTDEHLAVLARVRP